MVRFPLWLQTWVEHSLLNHLQLLDETHQHPLLQNFTPLPFSFEAFITWTDVLFSPPSLQTWKVVWLSKSLECLVMFLGKQTHLQTLMQSPG